MTIVKRELITRYQKRHASAKGVLEAWVSFVEAAQWKAPQDIKSDFRSVDFLKDNRIIFNIKGNHHRLLVKVSFAHGIVRILWIGTHAEYDKKSF